jgi:integrase
MASKIRQRLRAIIDYAVEGGIIPGNPLPTPRRGKRNGGARHLPAVLKRDGVGAILRAADTAEACRGIKRAHFLVAFTAQRIGEIVGAKLSQPWGSNSRICFHRPKRTPARASTARSLRLTFCAASGLRRLSCHLLPADLAMVTRSPARTRRGYSSQRRAFRQPYRNQVMPEDPSIKRGAQILDAAEARTRRAKGDREQEVPGATSLLRARTELSKPASTTRWC